MTRSPGDYASSALCALNTLVTAMNSTLNFLSHTDESFKDKTRVCGYNVNIASYETVCKKPELVFLYIPKKDQTARNFSR